MSEDCHNSDNTIPVEIGLACHYCGGSVTPEQAYICEMQNRDGSSETVVFHAALDHMCALRWGTERLDDISGRLEAIIALMGYINDGRERK